MQFENVYWDATLMGADRRQIRTALSLYGSRLSAVFLSGGVNDFAGIRDMRPVLGDNCSAGKTAAPCFRDGAEQGSLDWLLAKVKESCIALIDEIIGATWRTGTTRTNGQPASATGAARIILHNDDHTPARWLPVLRDLGLAK